MAATTLNDLRLLDLPKHFNVDQTDRDEMLQVALLTGRKDFLELQHEVYKQDIEKTQGAAEELMVAMDTEDLAVRVGLSFFGASEDFATEHVEGLITDLEEKKAKVETELDEVVTKLTGLKAKLTQKFGDGIGLD